MTTPSVGTNQADEQLARAASFVVAGQRDLAESMCRDILDDHPDHGPTLELLLSLLVNRPEAGLLLGPSAPNALLNKITDPIRRELFAGMLAEQRGRQLHSQQVPGFVAYDWLLKAKKHYLAAGDGWEAKARADCIDRILKFNPSIRPSD